MSDSAFVTRWSVQAPVDTVWQLISEPEDWPVWWPGVEKVELLQAGDEMEWGACGASLEQQLPSVSP